MELNSKQQKLIGRMTNQVSFSLFQLFKLPLAFLAGIRIESLNITTAISRIRHSWITTNPFKSVYFAVLAMAAELSSGALAMLAIEGSTSSIAMLVVESNGKYYKKATGRIRFTCQDGERFAQVIQDCISLNEPKQFTSHIKGINEQEELVCEFYFTWSFKKRS